MSIFRKFFGGEPIREEPVRQQPPSQEQVKPNANQISGELPQKISTPESRERPRIVKAQQCKYGKVLQSPDGPIVPGSEHAVTGKSTELPAGTAALPANYFCTS